VCLECLSSCWLYGVTEGVVGSDVVISVCCGVKWLSWSGV